MNKALCIAAGILLAQMVIAADPVFPVSDIPDALKENALAVVRLHEHSISYVSKGGYSYEERLVITILNDKGKEYAYLHQEYDNNSRVDRISATLYDSRGGKIRKIKLDEIIDVSEIGSGSLYTDSRAKVCYPEQNDYPFTIEYIVSSSYKSALEFPSWFILPDYNVSFQEGYYDLTVSKADEINYKARNFEVQPSVEEMGDKVVYHWKLGNIPAIKYEPNSKGFREVFPILDIKPENFVYNGFAGRQATWKEFGLWCYDLIQDRQELDPATIEEIKILVADCSSDREIVNKVYSYMQNRVRYVNIAEGIGGLQPIEAQRIHDVGYGDCKALSNYTKALLTAAGVDAVYTKIMAGESIPEVDEDFPTQQSNHVILMVPLEEDSIWLECTSQRLPPDYVGSFIDDRTVLFVTEEGGVLGHTPVFSLEENALHTNTVLDLDPKLDGRINRERIYLGTNFGSKYMQIYGLDEEDQRRSILSSFDLSGYNLVSFNYDYENQHAPFYVRENVEVIDDAILVASGDYVMLPLNLLLRKVSIPERTRNRKQDLSFKRNGMSSDTLIINLPENLEVYQLPDDQLVESDFGKYTSSVKKTESGLIFVRRIEYYRGEYPADRFSDYFDFCKAKSKADGQQVMLKLK